MLSFLRSFLSNFGIGTPKEPRLRLVFIRHATYGIDHRNQKTVVSENGKRALGQQVERLKAQGLIPDVIYSSPEHRAYASTDQIAGLFDIQASNIQTAYNLSDDSKDGQFAKQDLRNIGPGLKTVFCVSHGPTILSNVDFLTGDQDLRSFGKDGEGFYRAVSSLKNTQAVVVSFSQDDWSEITAPMSIEIIGP